MQGANLDSKQQREIFKKIREQSRERNPPSLAGISKLLVSLAAEPESPIGSTLESHCPPPSFSSEPSSPDSPLPPPPTLHSKGLTRSASIAIPRRSRQLPEHLEDKLRSIVLPERGGPDSAPFEPAAGWLNAEMDPLDVEDRHPGRARPAREVPRTTAVDLRKSLRTWLAVPAVGVSRITAERTD